MRSIEASPGLPPPARARWRLEGRRRRVSAIRVVSEDRNPVVDELLRRYPAADWAPSALADDVAQLVNARRVVYGVGTFLCRNQPLVGLFRPDFKPL